MRRRKLSAKLPRPYVDAFRQILSRIAKGLPAPATGADPLRMYIAGGAAQFIHTGARVSEDIDAAFSRRLIPPSNLEVAYVAPDGTPQTLYLDRQYNEAFGLVHEDAHEDAIPLQVEGIDPAVLDVRVFSPTDLAVSKLGRYEEVDRADIAALAHAGLIEADGVRKRAEEALAGYVGDTKRVRASIDLARRLILKHTP